MTGLELELHHRDTRGEIAQQLEGTPACALLAAERCQCLDIASLLYEFCHASNTNGPLVRGPTDSSRVVYLSGTLDRFVAYASSGSSSESIWKNIANLNGSFNSTSRATADGFKLRLGGKGRRTRMRPNW